MGGKKSDRMGGVAEVERAAGSGILWHSNGSVKAFHWIFEMKFIGKFIILNTPQQLTGQIYSLEFF